MRANAMANRRRIVAAARDVFGTDGVLGSTEDVAARAGVGIATVFRHFPSKDALVEEALRGHIDELHQLALELRRRPDPVGAFHDLLAVMVRTGGSKLTLAGLLGDPAQPPGAVLDAAAELRAEVEGLLRDAQDAGAVDRQVSIDELYFLLRGLAAASAARPPAPEVVTRAIDVLRRGLAPRRAEGCRVDGIREPPR